MVAGIAYFTMGADLGATGIPVEFKRNNPKVHGEIREIFYVRYIDWYATCRCSFMAWTRLTISQGRDHPSAAPGSILDRRSAMAHHPLHPPD